MSLKLGRGRVHETIGALPKRSYSDPDPTFHSELEPNFRILTHVLGRKKKIKFIPKFFFGSGTVLLYLCGLGNFKFYHPAKFGSVAVSKKS